MGVEVPEALQAVTLKAMARERAKRYASVEAFSSDIEAYQNGFATSAEDAGAWKRVKLWVARNKVLAGAAAVLLVVVSGFTARVVQKGREASEALQNLRETAPTFAVRARGALKDGSLVVKSSQGGGTKDTWIVDVEAAPDEQSESSPDRPSEASQSQSQEQG
jgi:negative regulator of sigma E activity